MATPERSFAVAVSVVEPGTVATPFERRDDEMYRCQRYLRVLSGTQFKKIGTAVALDSTYVMLLVPLAPPMRANQQTSFAGSFIASGAQGNLNFAASNISNDAVVPEQVSLKCTTSQSGTASGAGCGRSAETASVVSPVTKRSRL